MFSGELTGFLKSSHLLLAMGGHEGVMGMRVVMGMGTSLELGGGSVKVGGTATSELGGGGGGGGRGSGGGGGAWLMVLRVMGMSGMLVGMRVMRA